MLSSYRQLTQLLNQSISQNKLDAGLPGLIKKCIEMEKKKEIDFMIQDTDELVKDCSDGAARIKSIVHEMRYFAHPEKQVIEQYSIADILKKVLARFSSQPLPGVLIKNNMGHLPQFACNVPHLEQAFANILQNAIEAVDGDGQISIDGFCRKETIEIKISDTGRGIAPEKLPLVFNPFFTTKDVGQGLGLGLTTALNIIKMHNGSINCMSNPDKQTSVTISLPYAGEQV